MKLLGFICLIIGGGLIATFALYKVALLLISGPLIMLKAGIVIAVVGLIILLIAALVERSQKEDFQEVDQ
ncbi:MAG: hypothetical protein HQ591_07590 [candidate division Zixibacteria bacterium]|nr:hypothetical protein [Candidatus Tariuqbacter arcticus]